MLLVGGLMAVVAGSDAGPRVLRRSEVVSMYPASDETYRLYGVTWQARGRKPRDDSPEGLAENAGDR